MRVLTKQAELAGKEEPFEQNTCQIKIHQNVHLGKILEIHHGKVYESSKPIFLQSSKPSRQILV